MTFRPRSALGAALLLASAASTACDLQFTSASTALTYPVPGQTAATAQFTFTNLSDTACLQSPSGGLSGIVVNGVIDPLTSAVSTTSYAPFAFQGSLVNPPTLGCTNVNSSAVVCQSSNIAPGADFVVQLAFTAPGTISPPYCFQAASYTNGSTNPIQPFTSPNGFDAITGCAGQTGGGGNPLLIASKVDAVDPVFLGDQIEYEITVTAQDAGVSPPPVVTDTLPPEVTYVGFEGPALCNHTAGVVTCQLIGSFPSGSVAKIRIFASADQVGTVNNTCTVMAPGGAGPPVDDSNCNEETTILDAQADLVLAKTDTQDPVQASGPITYLLTTSNAGPSAVSGVVTVVDTLPAGVSYVSAAGTGWTCGHAAGTVTCTRPGAPVGPLPEISVFVTAPATAGTVTNTATISAGITDPTPANNTDTEDTTVAAVIDLDVVKTGPGGTVRVGDQFDYVLTLSNAGPSAASSIMVTDTLPAAVSFVSASGTGWSCSHAAGTVTCTRAAAVAAGASAPPITIRVLALTAGNALNTCVATANAPDVDGQPSCTETTPISPLSSDLMLTKTDTPDPVQAGGALSYTLATTNVGPSAVPGTVTVVDTLPAGVAFVSASGTGWSCSAAASTVTCTRSGAAVAALPAITLQVTAPATAGTITNTATISSAVADPTPANNTDTEDTTVNPSIDLDVVKTGPGGTVRVGDQFDYVLTLSNAGPSAASSVSVVDTLPASVSFVSASGSGWTCNHAAGTVTCTRAGTVAAGASAPAITIRVQALAEGNALNTCVASANAPDVNGQPSCTETTPISPLSSDLVLTKTDTPDPVQATGALSYTLATSNAGPSAVPGTVTVVDTLPAGVAFVSASGSGWTCNHAAGTVTCTRTAAAVGALPAITVDVTAPATAGTITNTATISSAVADPTPANNTDEEPTQVTGLAGYAVSKVDSMDPVPVGTAYSYTITTTNTGPSSVASPVVTDTLPPGVGFVSAAGTGWTCNQAAGVVTCTRATLAVGSSTITVNVTAPLIAGTIVNRVTIASGTPDPDPLDNEDEEPTTITPVVDLDVVKTGPASTVRVGDQFDYVLTLSNAGPSPAGSVVITDTLPASVSFVSASGTGWTCGHAAGTVTCSLASAVAPGTSAAPVTIRVQALTAGNALNTCVASANAPDANGQPSCTETTPISPLSSDLSLVKTDTPDPVQAAGALTYTLATSNAGPSVVPGTVTVSDTLPAGVAFVSASGSGWSCSAAASTVTCTRSGAPVGALPAITLQVTAPAAAGTITNTATISSATADPTPANNTDSEDTTVNAAIDLDVLKTGPASTVRVGDQFDYVLTLSNAGPSAATSLSVVDTLPAAVSFVSASGTGWTCNHAAGTVTCTRGGSLAAGASAPPITIRVQAAAEGNALNTCVASANAPDVNGQPSCTETTPISPLSSDLSLVKTDTPDPVQASGALSYTLAVSNAGPSAVPGTVTVTDTLPAGVAFLSATGTGWTCSAAAGTVTCTRSGAAVGALPSIAINVTAPAAAGVITNTATVSSPTADPTPGNNTDTEETTVNAVIDLDVVKTGPASTVRVGDQFDYVLTLSNAGPSAATGVSVVDTLPASVSFVSATGSGWSCSNAAGVVTCTRAAAVAAGTSAPPITIRVQALAEGDALNTCVASANAPDANGQPSCTETTPISPLSSDLALVKTDTPDPVQANGSLTYTLATSNAGPSAVPGTVTVSDTLPAGVGFVSASGTGWTCGQAAGTVTCTRSGAPVGALPAITVAVTAPADAGSLLNTATISSSTADPTPGNNTDTEPTQVTGLAGYSISKTDSMDPVPVGTAYSYLITATNTGPSTVVSPVVTDTLPAGVSFVSAAGTGWTCGHAAGVVTCTRASLAVGTSTITVNVTAPLTDGTVVNRVTIASSTPDPDPLDNEDQEPTGISPVVDLDVLKTGPATTVRIGDEFDYVLTLSNAGPSAASSISVTDSLPPSVTFVSATGSGWTCSHVAGTVTCTRGGSIAAGSSAPPITLRVLAIAEGTVLNTCVASANAPDANGQPSCTESTPISPLSSDLSLVKTDTPDPVQASGALSYTLATSNAGPSAVPGTVTVTDTLPAGVGFVSAGGTGWSCSAAASTVTCTRSGAPVGALPAITLQVTAPAGAGTITNTATISSGTADPTPGNNTDTEETGVNAVIDLDVLKTGPASGIVVGAEFDYVLTLSNAGPSAATGVSVVDTLPAAVSFVSATGSGWSCSHAAGTVTCTRAGSVAAGSSAPPITLRVRAVSEGDVLNTCVASANAPDANGQPSCTESTPIGPVVDLDVLKTGPASTVRVGDQFDYLLTLSNAGPSTASSVTVTDTLPAAVSFVSASGTGWSCSHAAGVVGCSLSGTVAAGASAAPITLRVLALSEGDALNTCVASANAPDANGQPSCTETTPIGPAIDLDVLKTGPAGPIMVGQEFDYVLTLSNAGPSAASSVMVSDTLPASVAFVSASGTNWSCSHAAGLVVCSYTGSVAAGASAPAITLRVRALFEGNSINTCTATGNAPDPNGQPSCTETTPVTPAIDLDVLKTGPAAAVNVGAEFDYVLTLSNAGPSVASSVVISDTLPSAVSFVSASGVGWSCSHAAGLVTCSLSGSVAAGASAAPITVRVLALSEGLAVNTCVASANAPDANGQPSCTESTPIGPVVDLDVLKTGPAGNVRVGEEFDYVLTLSNAGPSAATSVSVVDTLPAGVAFVSAGGTGWTCSNAAGTVTCSRAGSVAAGTSAPPITLRVRAVSEGDVLNTCVASANAPDANGQPSCTETTTILPAIDLDVVKTGPAAGVRVGDEFDYVLSVSNAGPSAASSVVVTDTLPAAVSFVSGAGTGWTCSHAAGTVSCSLAGSIGAGATATPITIRVRALTEGNALNTCVASANAPDLNGQPSCTETTPIGPAIDLDVVKTGPTGSVLVGDEFDYVLTLSNAGPSAASSISVTDTLPAAVSFVSAAGPGWTCGHAAGVVTCSRGGSVAAGSSAPPITLRVLALTEGTAVNTCVASANAPDANGQPSCTETTPIGPLLADLDVVKTGPAANVRVGEEFDYVLTLTNAGPSAATAVSVVDTLPAAVAFVSAGGTGWTCSNTAGTVTCTRAGSVAAGTSAPPITVRVRALTEGDAVNTCVASSNAPDVNGQPSCTETTTITPVIDLDVLKTGPTANVRVGQEFDYTLVLSNAGPSTASAVVVTDTLPAAVAFVSASGTGWTCSNAAGTVTCSLSGTVAAGASASPITVRVRALTEGDALNTCVASANAPDSNGQPSCTETTPIGPAIDLDVVKTGPATNVQLGAEFDYSLVLSNAGPSAASSVVVTDTLPAAVSFVSAGGTGWSCSHAAGIVTCSLSGSVAAGASAAPITVRVLAVTEGEALNTCVASANAPDLNGQPSCTETTVIGPAIDLDVLKTGPAGNVRLGDEFDYLLTLSNAGPSAASSVSVVDTLPAGVSFVSASGTGWTCSNAAGTVTCSLAGTVAAGASATPITVRVLAVTEGEAVNTCVASANAPDVDGQPSCTETTVIGPAVDLDVLKTGPSANVRVGQEFDYLLTLSNAGPSAASSVVVTDTLPAAVSFVSASGTGWTCSNAAGVVTCSLSGTVAAGASAAPITVRVRAVTEGEALNTCVASANAPDVNGQPSCTETTVIGPAVDLDVLKTGPSAPVLLGAEFDYTLTLSNAGPSAASSVVVTDPLPAQVSFVSASGTGWTCGHAAGVVTCSLSGSVAAGASAAPITVRVLAVTEGTAVNTCTATANAPDPNGQPSCTETTVIGPVVDLDVVKTGPSSNVRVGEEFDYILTLSNAGPSAASSVSVVDTLPAAVSFVSASGTGWSCAHVASVVTCTLPGPVAAGTSAPAITIRVQAQLPGDAVNTCIATASAPDVDGQPSCTETTPISPLAADLVLVKTDTPDPVQAGGALSYTLATSNLGPSVVPGTVTVVDTLPAGVGFVSASGTGWSCSAAAGTVTCTRSGAALGELPAIALTVTAPATGGTISNTATIGSAIADPVPENNTDTEPTVVLALAFDLEAIKSASPEVVGVGQAVTFAFSVRNVGEAAATGVELADDIPLAFDPVSATGEGWTCSISGNRLSCAYAGTLAPGATAPLLYLETLAQSPGTHENVCVATADQVDADGTPMCRTDVVVTPPEAVQIPALSTWAVLLLLTLMLGTGAYLAPRRG